MPSRTPLPTVDEWQAMDETDRLRTALRYLVEQVEKANAFVGQGNIIPALTLARDALGERAAS